MICERFDIDLHGVSVFVKSQKISDYSALNVIMELAAASVTDKRLALSNLWRFTESRLPTSAICMPTPAVNRISNPEFFSREMSWLSLALAFLLTEAKSRSQG